MKGKKTFKRFMWIVVLLAIVGFVAYAYFESKSTVTFINEDSSSTSTPSVSPEQNRELEEIRNRADIKKQQELIVKETYLTEKKSRIEHEKEEAIKQYDAQLAGVETDLEGVRAEKMSFQ